MKMERSLVVWLIWAAMVVAELQGLSGCVEKERMGLMELWKAVKPHDLTPLPSDCCLWYGVNCSAITGRVESLTLYPGDNSPKHASYFLNISLFIPFEQLLELHLKWFSFDGLINQADLIKLTKLEKLSMTYTNLSNVVSLQDFLANIKNLKYLDIRDNNMNINLEGICEIKNIIELHLVHNHIRGHLPSCIGNLTQLRILDLRDNQISGNIPSIFGNLSHLSFLSLGENYWSGSFSLHSLANNSKLENLFLSSNDNHFQLATETQSWFPSFQLLFLDLSNSNLNIMSDSIIPTFLLNQSELTYIDLSDNKLQDTFPSWLLQNNSKLQTLLMKNNFLMGNLILPNFIHGLMDVDISNNKIDGKLPDNLQVFLPALHLFNISENRFEGNLPSSFGALKQLQFVDLSFNSFCGKLPKTLFADNFGLMWIDISNNLLHGEISLNLTTLPSMTILNLSNNKFNGSFQVLPSKSLSPLEVADFSALQVLIISKNSLEGEIPDILCNISTLLYLDMSHNNLSGSIPSCLTTSSIMFLYLRNCSLSGIIPDGFSNKSTLVALDLSYNDFSPSAFPNWIYSQYELRILLMAGLQLEGEIPTHICRLKNIKIMDLSHNDFNGSIPLCLFKMPFWVAESQDHYFDFVHNFLVYSFSRSYRFFEVEYTTKGTSNLFQGSILDLMTGLDVSSNKLRGQIPPQIGDLEAIHALNLSNNRLWGSIPDNISKLRDLESLDLSSNSLSGEIPSEIVRLNFLSFFNVSNNNLSGPTPNGGQFSNFDERNYEGNEFLCGSLLHRVCTNSSQPTLPDGQEDDEAKIGRTSFWWSFIASYVIMVISSVVLLGINTRFSRIWFRSVDVICSKLFCAK